MQLDPQFQLQWVELMDLTFQILDLSLFVYTCTFEIYMYNFLPVFFLLSLLQLVSCHKYQLNTTTGKTLTTMTSSYIIGHRYFLFFIAYLIKQVLLFTIIS